MAISESRSRGGDAFEFDDIGCLAKYIKAKQNRAGIATYFLTAYGSQRWVSGEQTRFVISPEFEPLMSSGIAAYRTISPEQRARAATAEEALPSRHRPNPPIPLAATMTQSAPQLSASLSGNRFGITLA